MDQALTAISNPKIHFYVCILSTIMDHNEQTVKHCLNNIQLILSPIFWVLDFKTQSK